MSVELRLLEDEARVTLSGMLAMEQAADFAVAMAEALKARQRVVVDTSALDGMALAGLQVVCATHRQARRLGRELSVCDGDSGLGQAARRAGYLRESCPNGPCPYHLQ